MSVGDTGGDLPGVFLPVGTTASAVLDRTTKPWDVYHVDLEAGVAYQIYAEPGNNTINRLQLFGPAATSRRDTANTIASWVIFGHYFEEPYTPAVSGRYYLALEADYDGGPYKLIVR
jgi:hypothetical protein